MGLHAYVEDKALIEALVPYGDIKGEVIRLKYKADHDLASLENGNRLVRMILNKPSIPYSLKIGDEWCRIIHNNQQPICRECNQLGHSRRKCPTVTCNLCKQVGLPSTIHLPPPLPVLIPKLLPMRHLPPLLKWNKIQTLYNLHRTDNYLLKLRNHLTTPLLLLRPRIPLQAPIFLPQPPPDPKAPLWTSLNLSKGHMCLTRTPTQLNRNNHRDDLAFIRSLIPPMLVPKKMRLQLRLSKQFILYGRLPWTSP